MRTYRLALVGFGTVGQGLATILRDKGEELERQHGARFVITAACTARRGSAVDPAGMAPGALLEAMAAGGLHGHPSACDWDTARVVAEAEADVLVESTWTELVTAEPSTGYIHTALNRGLHVVTANKGPLALFGAELATAAREQGLFLGYEGTVMAGTPALRLALEALAGSGVSGFSGILNGTTNFILSKMEAGGSYEDALAEAQRLGYAEADPAGDVEGHDAAAKVAILSTMVLGHQLRPAEVETTGITGITAADIAAAQAAGERWKLIGSVERTADGVRASVRPQRLPLSHPLAHVSGTTNAVSYATELLGPITLVGSGAGAICTGFALLSDLLALHRRSEPLGR